MKSGGHRVQRVPETESGGRIHTSAANRWPFCLRQRTLMLIFVQKTFVLIHSVPKARGGQHVNTTDSAVRVVHVPTGTVAECQDARSQHKNKAKALIMLKSRILEAQMEKAAAERAGDRKLTSW